MPAHRFRPGRAVRLAAGGAALLGLVALPAAAVAAVTVPPPTEVAIVVPIVAPARETGLIDVDELAKLTAPGGSLTRTLSAVADLPVTLAVDPLIAASVAALGEAAPASAVAWLERLRAVATETIDLAPADADPALLAASGHALPTTPWLAWTATGGATAGLVEGIGDAPLIVADTDLRTRADPTTARALLGTRPALVIDSTASAALASAVHGSPTAALRDALDGGRTSVVLGLPRDGRELSGLRSVLAELGSDPAVVLVPLTGLAPKVGDAVLAEAGDGPRSDLARAVVAAGDADAAFASITADPEAVAEARRLRAAALASVAWEHDPDWPDVVEAAIADSSAYRASVRIQEVDSLFLADRSSIPVAVVNDLSEPVTVVVTVRAADGRLDIDPRPITVVVPASTTTTVEFAASAISNGAVAVTARLESTSGVPIGPAAVASVNVQAGWETPIVAAALGLLLIVIVLGVIRTVRRVRRSRTATDPAQNGSGDG